jgi:hypothetical protein
MVVIAPIIDVAIADVVIKLIILLFNSVMESEVLDLNYMSERCSSLGKE